MTVGRMMQEPDTHVPCKTQKYKNVCDMNQNVVFFLPVIDIQAFERLLGPCIDIMKRNISQYEDQLVALFGSSDDLKQ